MKNAENMSIQQFLPILSAAVRSACLQVCAVDFAFLEDNTDLLEIGFLWGDHGTDSDILEINVHGMRNIQILEIISHVVGIEKAKH